MSNTNLPVGLNTGNTGHIQNHNILHEEVNRLSRDTGVRDIRHLLINGWTADKFTIQRVNDVVYVCIRGLKGTDATDADLMAYGADDSTELDYGFRPEGSNWMSPLYHNGDVGLWAINSVPVRIRASSSTGNTWRVTTDNYDRTLVWTTSAPWPNQTLPLALSLG